MRFFRRFLTRLGNFAMRRRNDERLKEEIETHLALQTEENIRAGIPPAEARRQAKLKFGAVEAIKEDYRAERGLPFIESLLQDIRYGLRVLRKSPGFAAAAILALAVGIGANAANFSVFDAVVWHAIPVRNFGRLVLVNGLRRKEGNLTGVSYPDFLDWQSRARLFAGLAAFRYRRFDRTGAGPAEIVNAAAITPNFYRVLGAKPMLGRSFTRDESEPGKSHVAILSYRYWQSEFAGNPHAVGRTIELNHAGYSIVGVMPRDIEYPETDICVPLALSGTEKADRSLHNLTALGLLKPGVSVGEAQAELKTLAAGLAKAFPETNQDLSNDVRSLRVYVNGNLTYAWGLMFAVAMGLVLLIACANVTNLQLARGTSRQKEIAVRASLGATRGRVVRQLMIESVLTALFGAGGGLLLAEVGTHLASRAMPSAIARLLSGWDRIRVSPLALAFTIGIAVGAGILSGILPALYSSKPDLVETLKEGGRTQTPGRAHRWLQGALVVAQVALALGLLVGTALMVSGFQEMLGKEKQFAPSTVLLFQVTLPPAHYKGSAERLAFYQQSLRRLRSMPGGRSVSAFTTFPMSNNGTVDHDFEVAGGPRAGAGRLPWAATQSVSAGFFGMLHIPLLAGRDFNAGDGPGSARVAIVSQHLAGRYWPTGGAIGRQIRLYKGNKPGPWLTIVGVVGNVLWDWTDETPEYAIFQPYTQAPASSSYFAIRDGSDPDALVPTVRRDIAAIDPSLPVTGARERQPETLRQAIHDSTGGIGFIAGLMSTLGIIAFGLAAIGVYSVMAYSVVARTHEIGVRAALGANSARVLGLMMRRGAVLLGIGVAVGLPLSYALSHLLASFVYGVKSNDPLAFAASIAVLAAAALLASYLPARKAARIDPIAALRNE